MSPCLAGSREFLVFQGLLRLASHGTVRESGMAPKRKKFESTFPAVSSSNVEKVASRDCGAHLLETTLRAKLFTRSPLPLGSYQEDHAA